MTLDIHTRAVQYPTRTAVVDRGVANETPDQTYTYADLSALVTDYGARLTDHGVGEGDAICVVSRNRIELLCLFYAAVDRGAVLAPVSYRLPADAISALIDRIDPTLALAEPRFEELVSNPVTIEGFTAGDPETDPESLERVPRDPDRPLLYIHTGGTTGVPKVVVCPYRQVEWNAITEIAAWGLGKGDVSPLFLPMFHTGGWNLLTLPSLYVGGTVVLHREFDPDQSLETVETYGATHLFGVAAIYQTMVESDRFEDTDFGSVDWCLSGGGPTPTWVFEAFREHELRLGQGYGLTEGGPNNLYLDPDRDVDLEKRATSVGRPFPDSEVRIVDADGDPVDPGTIGELEVRGPITADGYLDTEDGTFDGEWVSTGDLARVDEHGDHYITGRTDNMFVSGGENVYPEEVEAAFERHEDVADVGVVGISHDRWGTVPKAVIELGDALADEDPAVLEETFDAFARETLADYQLPRAYAFVDSLPRSGPGKLDRGALDAQYGDGSADGPSGETGGDATDGDASDDDTTDGGGSDGDADADTASGVSQ